MSVFFFLNSRAHQERFVNVSPFLDSVEELTALTFQSSVSN